MLAGKTRIMKFDTKNSAQYADKTPIEPDVSMDKYLHLRSGSTGIPLSITNDRRVYST